MKNQKKPRLLLFLVICLGFVWSGDVFAQRRGNYPVRRVARNGCQTSSRIMYPQYYVQPYPRYIPNQRMYARYGCNNVCSPYYGGRDIQIAIYGYRRF